MVDTVTDRPAPHTIAPTEVPAGLRHALARLPVRGVLSFEPLIAELDRRIRTGSHPGGPELEAVLAAIQKTKALRGPLPSTVPPETASEQVRILMGFVFPDLSEDDVLARAFAPFATESFYATRRYREVFGSEDVALHMSNGYGERDYYRENLLFAYSMLFHIHFKVPHQTKVFVKGLTSHATGLERFFQVDYQFRFVEAHYPDLQVLPQAEYARLLAMEDLNALIENMPLDGVVFSGFNTIRYEEITELHNLSLLKSELVMPGAFDESPARFARIVQRLRSVFQVPDLDAGVVLRYRDMQEHRHCTTRSLLQNFDGCIADIEQTIYGEAIRGRQPLFVPDLQECDCDSEIVEHLRSRGVRSCALIPLVEHDEVIGVLELTSRTPEEIHPAAAHKIADLLPPLTTAARREMEEVRGRIERTLKTHCTAIHPAVEWRFEDAAYAYNHTLSEKGVARFPDIVFEDVHPLYGAMDIRGSSARRNEAIQTDLVEHLGLACQTLREIYERHPMPMADYYASLLARLSESVARGLSSGDELSVIELLHQRVEPFLAYVRDHVPEARASDGADPVSAYEARMDPRMRILYRHRKDYEDSVAQINETLTRHLDREEEKAQSIFPHYFEKYVTDGVEYDLYVGQSMTRDRTFDSVQLQNLRLWQLQLMCGLAREANAVLPTLRVPLETTPLVLVQSSPITIQFRSESKQFEVEGSYNIRYEIMKKRIDKSTVRGTGERLTQPGRLAVIFSQDKEGEEYLRYLEYLVDRGLLLRGVEELELEDLQGVSGLRALRGRIVL